MNARHALLNLVGSEPLPEPPAATRASRQFVEDFELVAEHYGLHESGEYMVAKEAARADLEAATVTFATLADEIRKGNT